MTQVIVFSNANGSLSVCTPSGDLSLQETAERVVPKDTSWLEVNSKTDLPQSSEFFGAWVLDGSSVVVDLDKAKAISHGMRRRMRAKEFAPYDDVIAKQIPGNESAEAERVQIREKYAQMQLEIDEAETVEGLLSVLGL